MISGYATSEGTKNFSKNSQVNLENFKIFEECGVFTVMIPEQNQNYFKKSKLVFAFNEKISNDNRCELIVPGSKILFQIILI